jgi:hypothetical protein
MHIFYGKILKPVSCLPDSTPMVYLTRLLIRKSLKQLVCIRVSTIAYLLCFPECPHVFGNGTSHFGVHASDYCINFNGNAHLFSGAYDTLSKKYILKYIYFDFFHMHVSILFYR